MKAKEKKRKEKKKEKRRDEKRKKRKEKKRKECLQTGTWSLISLFFDNFRGSYI